MTITLPMPEKDDQPPAPNPLNVLNLLLSKLKAMETSESTEEISEVDVELCNKIYYILNPAAAPPPEQLIPTDDLAQTVSEAPLSEENEATTTEEAPPTEGAESVLTEGSTPVIDTPANETLPTETPLDGAPIAEVASETALAEPAPVEAAA